MQGSAVEVRVQRLNAVRLTSAVLCVNCDVVSDSPHDHCLVCGSRSLFNVGSLLGRMPKETAKVIAAQPRSSRSAVLVFPRARLAAFGQTGAARG